MPSSPNVMFSDAPLGRRQPGDLSDVRVAISGLVKMFKVFRSDENVTEDIPGVAMSSGHLLFC